MSGIKRKPEEDSYDEMEDDGSESEELSSDHTDDGVTDGECERRRQVCLQKMDTVERQFYAVREQLYRETMSQLDSKLRDIQCRRAPEYVTPLEKLEQDKNNRIEVAGVLRKLRLASIQTQFEAEKLAAVQDYENEKSMLMESIQQELEEKINQLKEDGKDASTSLNEKGDVPSEKRRKPATVKGPYIVYMLHEKEILEDVALCSQAATSSLEVSKK